MTSSTDRSCHNNTDAVLVDAKDIVRYPKRSFKFKVDCKGFVGSPADMTMSHANNKLPKVACTNKGGHKYGKWSTTNNKRYKIWECDLQCTFCELRIECSCEQLKVGMAKRLFRRILGVKINQGMRMIHIRYDNLKLKRLVA